MKEKVKTYLILLAFTLIPVILVWLPFFLRVSKFWGIPLPVNGMATIVANYDGPLYLAVAKSFYSKEIISQFSLNLNYEYYAAHFPLYPLLIRIFSPIFGYPYSMLFVTVLSSFLAVFFFFKLAGLFVEKKDALFLTFLFGIFPARFLIVRSVGSPEPLFMATIIASIYYFKKGKYLLSAISAALAQLTKSPGILLFVAYFIYFIFPVLKKTAHVKNINILQNLNVKRLSFFLIIPISLIAVFAVYAYTFGDFFAYFKSGDNIHIFFPPFSIFNYSATWVGTFWLEEVIFVYLLGLVSLVKLYKKETDIMFLFSAIFFTSILFVSHRDLIRYALPLSPFFLISFSDYLVKKEFKYILAVLVIPIYLFSLAYISQNTMPIGNWAPFL